MSETVSIVLGNKENLIKLLEKPEMINSLKAIAGKYMTAERINKLMILAASRQPKLYNCTPRSFLDACIKSAELGLDFGGATGQAYLVPFKNGNLTNKYGYDVYDCSFIPGYQGLTELVYRAGTATYVDAQLVYAKDKFKYNLGTDPFVVFEPCLDDDRGGVKCAFAIVRLKDSQFPKIEIMSKKQLLDIKARSKAKDSGPWQTDEPEMMRKTVLRRALKYIPKTPEIEEALDADNQLYDISLPAAAGENRELGVNGLKKKIKSKEVEKPVAPHKADVEITDETTAEMAKANDLRPKYLCDECNRLVIELIKDEKGRDKCPFEDCKAIGYIREATEKDYADQGYK